ncbi:Retrotransposon-derived protein PEG10 [Zancudomyces culisetae]|uniref:Retrotransposon-derived protein PEG10 n=1 Tax=Zancudomyces culisetae TaxID=1213189 RepID=A0A1R1PXT4_ZANCU|nr:Retrotransposon-derived protein PEG10 [Zancudomyces culisetae]|eukprot:OMH85718.1 Retrotransposon-derived protein PEG10 [Zancudomyces culisetae]
MKISFGIQARGDLFKTEKNKIVLIGAHLTGPTAIWFNSLIEEKSTDLANYAQFLELFKKNFSDPSQEIRDRGEIRRCKHGPRSVANYAAEFRTSARISGFDQAALIDQFLRGLNDNVMNFLMMNDMPTKLEDTIALAVKVDNRLSNRRMLRSAPGYYNSSFQRPITKAIPVQSTMHDDLPPGEPMEIDALVTKQRPHLSQEEKDRRRALGLIMYCGNQGHIAIRCPNKTQSGKVHTQ